MIHRKIYFSFCLIFIIPFLLKAQDVQFSQFYEAVVHTNPAFAGSYHHTRGMFHQRLQWPGLDAKYTTSLFSVDGYLSKYNSGVGMMFFHDQQGGNTISSTEVDLQYSYELHISRTCVYRHGFQLGYVSRNLNYADLTFPRQYDNNGLNGVANPFGYGKDRANFVDVSSGGVFYSENFWIGLSAHHLNIPNQSFIRGDGHVSRLPVKVAMIAGYKIPLIHKKYMASIEEEPDISITPTVHYKFQGKSDQLDVGIYAIYEYILGGVWYRGLPIKTYERIQNNESIVVLMGWKIKNWNVSYSYDFVISKLTGAKPRGAHELNITYIYYKSHRKKPMKRLPCPTFYRRH